MTADPTLVRLVYSSRATSEMSLPKVLTILAKSRIANRARDVTGLLLYADGVFLQALEGPRTVVETLLASIMRDTRHTDVRVLLKEPVRSRLFEGWSMGHADATIADLQAIPSLSGFLIDGRGLESLPDAAVRDLLQAFRDGAFALKAG